LQNILAARAEPDAVAGYQQLVLRMLGLTPEDSAKTVARSLKHLTKN